MRQDQHCMQTGVADLHHYLSVCDQNYHLMMRVLISENAPDSSRGVYVTLLENTPYTSLVRAIQRPALPPWVSTYEWMIRLYHDAKTAEILSFQDQRPLKPAEQLCNPYLHHKDEKNQNNLFLNQWLAHTIN